jgi:hypothetical protein
MEITSHDFSCFFMSFLVFSFLYVFQVFFTFLHAFHAISCPFTCRRIFHVFSCQFVFFISFPFYFMPFISFMSSHVVTQGAWDITVPFFPEQKWNFQSSFFKLGINSRAITHHTHYNYHIIIKTEQPVPALQHYHTTTSKHSHYSGIKCL